MKLKSGITKEWLRKNVDAEGKQVDRDIWLDEFGYWHEKLPNGNEIRYDKKQAEVLMHDARGVEQIPEEQRICGFWLKLDGKWVAPMVCLGYKNNPATAQVIYTERTDHDDGSRTLYSETLILDEEKGARVHIASVRMTAELQRVEEECWEEWVDINERKPGDGYETENFDCH